jgi:hypothetical protein
MATDNNGDNNGDNNEELVVMEGTEHAGVTKEVMMHTLFEFVDQWTEGTSLDEYLAMLDKLYEFVFGAQTVRGEVLIIGMHVDDFEPMQQAVKRLVAARYGCSDSAVRFDGGKGRRGRRPGRMYDRELPSLDGTLTRMQVPSTIVPFAILNAKQLAEWEARMARERAEAEARRKRAAAAAAVAAAVALRAAAAAKAVVVEAERAVYEAQLRAAAAARLMNDAMAMDQWRRGWGGANVWGGAGSVAGSGRLRRRQERKKLHRYYEELLLCAKVDAIESKQTEAQAVVSTVGAQLLPNEARGGGNEGEGDEDEGMRPTVQSIFGFYEEERPPLTVEATLAVYKAIDAAFDAAALAVTLAASAAAVVDGYAPEWAEQEQTLLSQRSKIRRNVWAKISKQRWEVYRRRVRWAQAAEDGNRRCLQQGVCNREWQKLRNKEKAGAVKEQSWWKPPHKHPGESWWKGAAGIPRRADYYDRDGDGEFMELQLQLAEEVVGAQVELQVRRQRALQKFAAAMSRSTHCMRSVDQAVDLFRGLDTATNGIMPRAEFQVRLERIGLGAWMEEEVEELLEAFDADGDGISTEELKDGLQAYKAANDPQVGEDDSDGSSDAELADPSTADSTADSTAFSKREANTREQYYARALSMCTPLPAEFNDIAKTQPHIRMADRGDGGSEEGTFTANTFTANTVASTPREATFLDSPSAGLPNNVSPAYPIEGGEQPIEAARLGRAEEPVQVRNGQSDELGGGRKRRKASRLASKAVHGKKRLSKKKQLEKYRMITHDHACGRRVSREFSRSRRRRRQHAQHAPITPSLSAATLRNRPTGPEAMQGTQQARTFQSDSLPAMLYSYSGQGLGASQLHTVLALRKEQGKRSVRAETDARGWNPPPISAGPPDLVS